MHTFLSFVYKEFLHILRDKRTMLILLGMPVMQILLFGFAISTELKNTDVAVLEPSGDAAAQRVVRELDASAYFRVTRMLRAPADIDGVFRRGEAGLVVVFPPRFGSALADGRKAAVQLVADGSEPNQAQMMTSYAQQVLARAVAAIRAEKGLAAASAPAVVCHTRMLFNPQAESSYNFVPGVMGMILLLICAMMTSVSIVREKETGTMEVLLASPTPPLVIIVAKAVPYFALSCVNLATILLLSKYVLGVPVQGSLAVLLGISLLYVLLGLSLGLFISNLVRTQMAAVLISGMGFIMPTIILSGLMFPIESMPPVLQGISAVVPARWYISAVRKVMIEGVPAAYVAREAAILAGMTAVFIAASVKQFKVRLS